MNQEIQTKTIEAADGHNSLYKKAWWLAVITIGYNIIEGLVSTIMGAEDESLALFGFGLDSFIEVISGAGILYMIRRITKNPSSDKSPFEKTALRITGVAFYLLGAGLIVTGIYNIYSGATPENTTAGLVISILSILTMLIIYKQKLSTGEKLGSKPIIADAKCTKVCLYMSYILLISSFLYWAFGLMYVDSIAAIALAYYSIKEGKESFDKIKGIECDDCC
jgi:divalent metal cation (Fe/Co/Zn/Cd) transporter